ncbi:hypothetical protein [Aeromonas hydrophila]|uniref:phage tail tube protein n=1 Tax=Aeromonas hydrophila TaxID=644 RepID=UPI000C33927C|nr:hypothetical protein [Aeromonas hydrophila]PKD25296.1 hypothetical protein AO056_01354 [Aeromonas hydrophila]
MSFTDKGLLLAGDVYIAEITNGVKEPLIGPINVNEITVTPPTTEEKSRISKKRSTFGQALDSVQLPKDPAKLSLKWDSMTKQLLADAIAGKQVDFTQAEAPVVDEPVTLSKEGWVELGNAYIKPGTIVVKLASGSTTLVLDTDYKANGNMVMALNDTAAVACKVSYTKAAVTGTTYTGTTETLKPRYFLIDGENLANPGQRVRVTIDQAMLAAQGALALMSGEFMEGELEGSLVTMPGKSDPYRIEILN